MMTKTLSQEICELCGVAARYNCKNVPCLNFISPDGICNITDKKCNPQICINYEPDTNHISWNNGIAYFPDFTKPENFVRLLELYSDAPQKTDVRLIDLIITSFIYINRNAFLDQLKICLKNGFFPTHLAFNIEYIKQAIRNAEWEY